jgi:hypothetical protein
MSGPTRTTNRGAADSASAPKSARGFAELERANDEESQRLIQLLLDLNPKELAGVDLQDLEAIQDLEFHEAEENLSDPADVEGTSEDASPEEAH